MPTSIGCEREREWTQWGGKEIEKEDEGEKAKRKNTLLQSGFNPTDSVSIAKRSKH